MTKRDPFVLVGLGIVGLTAIGASFTTLMGLAAWVGWHGWYMQILLPICLDVLAIVAGRVWLSVAMDAEARRFARTVSFAAIGLSIVGNAIGHIVTMQGASAVRIGLAIVVGSLPPAALAAVGHLFTLASLQVEPEPVDDEIVAESIESDEEIVPELVEAPQTRRAGRPAKKRPVALAYFLTERAAGRMPTGADLARAAAADPTSGSKWLREFQSDEKKRQTNTAGVNLTLVNA